MPENADRPASERAARPREPPGWLDRWRRRLRSRKVLVRDQSMQPTFEPGDRLLMDTASYRLRDVQRGDLVVVADPTEPTRFLLKRVVGLPGDFVRITRTGVQRASAPTPDEAPAPEGALEEIEVPTGQVFLLSDRPRHSRDSRQFGPVPLGSILGRVWRRYAPAGREGDL